MPLRNPAPPRHRGGGHRFPAHPEVGDLCYRSDLNLEFRWDGRRWRSTATFTYDQSARLVRVPVLHGTEATASDGTKYWTVT